MDTSEKLFCLWKFIEKKAFMPCRDDIVDWISCYIKFLYGFWGPDTCQCDILPDYHKVDGHVNFRPLGLKYIFNLELSLNKYNISIELGKYGSRFDYDKTFFDESSYFEKKWTSGKELKNASKNSVEDDIKKILEGKLAHPAIHQHIIYGNIPHNIRIGTSTRNPFLFLYQFAFQLCDCFQDFKESNLKKREFERLKKLFSDYIKNSDPQKRDLTIGPGKLFGL